MLTLSSSSCACVEADNSNLPAEKGSIIYQLLTSPDKVDIEHLSVEHFQVKITSSLLQDDVITQMCCRDALHWSVVSDIEEFYATDELILCRQRVMRHIRRCQTEVTAIVKKSTATTTTAASPPMERDDDDTPFTARELNIAIDLMMTACK